MEYKILNGKKLSKMTLGTVQLGMNYGIANNDGQPDMKKSHSMLSCALENGITSLDTARSYGNSEDVLGEFLKNENSKPFITSKVVVKAPDGCDEYAVEKVIRESVETSLDKLGINKLDCLLLHNAGDMTRYGNAVPKALEKLICENYTSMVGVSTYYPEELDTVLENDIYRAVQVPMSVFDQQLIHKGYIKKLYDAKITVFVRSVFLQGLFFLDPDMVDDELLKEYACPYIRKLRELCRQSDMSIAEFAISYIRDVTGVTSLVLGADSEEQVLQNIAYMNAPRIDDSIRKEAAEIFKDVNIEKIMEVLRRPKK